MLRITDRIFGFPLYIGRGKKKTIMKYVRNRWPGEWWSSVGHIFSDYGIGSFVNDCTGFNGRILSMDPVYYEPYPNAGFEILFDIDFVTQSTSCSLAHCGIEPKLSRDEVVRRKEEFIKNRPEWAESVAKEIGPDGEMVPPNNTKGWS